MDQTPNFDRITCSMRDYRPSPGIDAVFEDDTMTVLWRGSGDCELRLQLAVVKGIPTVHELAIKASGERWLTLGRGLVPEFGVTTGRRRTGHGLPYENRWDVYWDAPLSIPGGRDGNPDLPRNPSEVHQAVVSYQSNSCSVASIGERLEVTFPGLRLGPFVGSLGFTVYRGISLIRIEAIAKTEEPSLAFKYYGGLKGFSRKTLDSVRWRDVGGNEQTYRFGGSCNESVVPLRARNRLGIACGDAGALGFFPPPHKFFWARQLEINLGYVWYRKDDGESYSVGIRQGDHHEGYNPRWDERVFALYNAPPGTDQRMPVYFWADPGTAEDCRRSVMQLTRGDHYAKVPGYKTMVTHFHTAFGQELLDAGTLDQQPPWIPAFRSLGINIALINDFHGDGHPRDAGALRVLEQQNYYAACRRHSDIEFTIAPSEEPNAYLGGHYNVLFPRPVYWTHVRPEGMPLVTNDENYGRIYHTGSAHDVFEMLKAEGALVWQTHPRTKGSTFYPDRIKDTVYFQSDRWLGAAFKSLPVDLSEVRLGEVRCFGTLDDMNNWGQPKYMLGEVDTYKKFPEYDLFGDFNVNYVKLGEVPQVDDLQPLVEALRSGNFFVTTGEILIPEWGIERSDAQSIFWADVDWTFPLEFAELVWGDGTSVEREIIPATDLPAFGRHRFNLSFEPTGKKWVRFAVWDSAGNGAFTQPAHLNPLS